MHRFKTKKGLALLATLVVVGASAFGAYAYFTAGGTGTGTGSVGKSADTITVVGTAATAVTPGTVAHPGNQSAVTFTASNGSAFAQRISNIHLSGVKAFSGSVDITGTGVGQCDTSAFTMADVPVGVTDGDLAASALNVPLTEQGTLVMTDNGLNQNACESASLVLSFTTT